MRRPTRQRATPAPAVAVWGWKQYYAAGALVIGVLVSLASALGVALNGWNIYYTLAALAGVFGAMEFFRRVLRDLLD